MDGDIRFLKKTETLKPPKHHAHQIKTPKTLDERGREPQNSRKMRENRSLDIGGVMRKLILFASKNLALPHSPKENASMELYLHQNGEQVGPYTEEQIVSMVSSGQIGRDDIIWHEGLAEWQPIHSVVSLPAPVAPRPAPVHQVQSTAQQPTQIETNVKQGAIIGGWVCFALGLICMFLSLFMFFLYGPFFLVAFILSIVAMSQRRVLGGVVLLIATLVVPSVLGLVLFATRATEFAEDMSKSIEEASVSNPDSGSTDKPESIADAMKRGFEEAERESDLKALEELRNRKVEFDKKLAALKSFRVLSANFTKEENSIGMTEPLIELTVQNDTDHSVKRAYFRGVLASPGRAIPWIDDTFNYEIAGGVEPGEKTTWRLAPNMFSDWGKVEIRPDSKFTVTVIRLDGPDEEELFGDAHFGEHDEKRLAELEKKYQSEQGAAGQPATSPESE